MPIKGLSETVRLPRLGKIHLGTRHPEKGYPMKADHFVFPQDHPDYRKLVELFGETPKELRILIPVEDEETWASQYYKCYNLTYGLVCKGDGETAIRMVDGKTGEIPDSKAPTGATISMKELKCLGPDCSIYQNREKGKPQCHEVMNFRFMMPEIPGLGVWQIDTGSKNSILNINSCARLIKQAFGRLAMIPLKLTFEPMQVNNPADGKKRTVYVLNLRTAVTLNQLASAAREQTKMLTVGELEDAFDVEVEQNINELFPPESPTMAKVLKAPDASQERQGVAEKPQAEGILVGEEPPVGFANVGELLSWCKEHGISRDQFKEIVGVKEANLPQVNLVEAHQTVKDWLKEQGES